MQVKSDESLVSHYRHMNIEENLEMSHCFLILKQCTNKSPMLLFWPRLPPPSCHVFLLAFQSDFVESMTSWQVASTLLLVWQHRIVQAYRSHFDALKCSVAAAGSSTTLILLCRQRQRRIFILNENLYSPIMVDNSVNYNYIGVYSKTTILMISNSSYRL